MLSPGKYLPSERSCLLSPLHIVRTVPVFAPYEFCCLPAVVVWLHRLSVPALFPRKCLPFPRLHSRPTLGCERDDGNCVGICCNFRDYQKLHILSGLCGLGCRLGQVGKDCDRDSYKPYTASLSQGRCSLSAALSLISSDSFGPFSTHTCGSLGMLLFVV